MTLRDIRLHAVEKMESEARRLEKELAKMQSSHDSLKQRLFDTAKNLQDTPSSSQLLRQTEDLKKHISETVTTMHHMDARISRIKHRAERLRRNG